MLRASKGITSSLLAFWLIPAIRKKERSGPGTVAVAGADAAASDGSGDWTMRSCGAAGGPGGTALRTRGAKLAQTEINNKNRTPRRRGFLIAAPTPTTLETFR